MTALATIGNQTFMWGGLDLDRDQCVNELFNFHNISFSIQNGDPELKCRMYPGPETVQQSGYSSVQVSKFGIQIGEIPEPQISWMYREPYYDWRSYQRMERTNFNIQKYGAQSLHYEYRNKGMVSG